jgi:hypothetical protein
MITCAVISLHLQKSQFWPLLVESKVEAAAAAVESKEEEEAGAVVSKEEEEEAVESKVEAAAAGAADATAAVVPAALKVWGFLDLTSLNQVWSPCTLLVMHITFCLSGEAGMMFVDSTSKTAIFLSYLATTQILIFAKRQLNVTAPHIMYCASIVKYKL